MTTPVYVVRSRTQQDALVRLQSDPIVRGALERAPGAAVTIAPRDLGHVPQGSCVVFHFNDGPAINSVRSLVRSGQNLTAVCLGSDIYSFHPYLALHDFVSFYVMPTEQHRRILASQVCKPVFTLPEGIDSIVGCHPGSPVAFPEKMSSRFGYPESFEKGMASLVPILQLSIAENRISSFDLIVGLNKFKNRFGFTTIPFTAEDFATRARSYDYCLLSHFSLDLSVNSYIKSPNKLVTALMLGLIPIASRTPSYEALLVEFGLTRFLYESPAQLKALLEGLNPTEDARTIRSSGILEGIARMYSDSAISGEFLRILSTFTRENESECFELTPEKVLLGKPEVGLNEHLLDLVPSAARAFRARWRQMKAIHGAFTS